MSDYLIDSLHLNGNNHIFTLPYAVCSTAADVYTKEITLNNFVVEDGAAINVFIEKGSTYIGPCFRLKINGATSSNSSWLNAKVYNYSSSSVDSVLPASRIYTLIFDGKYGEWHIQDSRNPKDVIDYHKVAWLKRGYPIYEYTLSEPETFGADVVLISGYTKRYRYIYLSPSVTVHHSTGKFILNNAIVYEVQSSLGTNTYSLSFVDSDNNSLQRTQFLNEISTRFNNSEWTYIAAGDSVDSLDCVYKITSFQITSSQGVKDGMMAIPDSSLGEHTIELVYADTERYTANYTLTDNTYSGINEILYSNFENTYSDSDSPGVEYIRLGYMNTILPRSVRMKSGNYTGTGSEDTMELICDFEPKYIHLMSPWTNSGILRSSEYRCLLNEDGTINGINLSYIDQEGNDHSLTTRCADWYPTLSKSDNLYTVGNLPNSNGKKYQYMILGGH